MTATMTKETSLMFTDPMVRAIIDGSKTQTRRVAIPPAPFDVGDEQTIVLWATGDMPCPYGGDGDLIWVKEGVWCTGTTRIGKNGQPLWPKFDDDTAARRWFARNCVYTSDVPKVDGAARLNKMFMPRWASRLTLEVTDVRVERVQDISEADAKAEGIRHWHQSDAMASSRALDKWCNYSAWVARDRNAPRPTTATDLGAFAMLWDSINGKTYPWASNVPVWVVSFKKAGAQ